MLVGLAGQAGSGKDTVYERAKLKYPEAKRISFADKLKESAAALLGISVKELNELKNQDEPQLGLVYSSDYHVPLMTFRTFLQRYGTESHRDVFGDDFWIDQALRDYDGHTLTFVTDVRFPNEADAIKNGIGKTEVWRVIGPNFDPNPTHPSEQILDNSLIDVDLDNRRRDDNFKSLDAMIELLIEKTDITPEIQARFGDPVYTLASDDSETFLEHLSQ